MPVEVFDRMLCVAMGFVRNANVAPRIQTTPLPARRDGMTGRRGVHPRAPPRLMSDVTHAVRRHETFFPHRSQQAPFNGTCHPRTSPEAL